MVSLDVPTESGAKNGAFLSLFLFFLNVFLLGGSRRRRRRRFGIKVHKLPGR